MTDTKNLRAGERDYLLELVRRLERTQQEHKRADQELGRYAQALRQDHDAPVGEWGLQVGGDEAKFVRNETDEGSDTTSDAASPFERTATDPAPNTKS